MLKLQSLVVLIGLVVLGPVEGNVKGAAILDENNFDRVISRFDNVLVKFDAVYPYGDKHDAFKHVAEEMKDSDDILFVTIGIKDFGEHDNQKLAERFGIKTKNDWPALRLFVKGEDEPFSMSNKHVWSEDQIKKFIREHSNVYLGLQGCLEKFDMLAAEFAGSSLYKQSILEKTEQEAEKIQNEAEKKTAKTYIKYMTKAIEKETFIEDEKRRLNKILTEGKIKADKKQDLQLRANILASFSAQKSEL
ncbi:unnamed protein product [Ceutorhynchus assimilis]|uniref:Endoplasmic reticulum resident protein 29 n=1 Tax=Ceutorhynchus assimilis TaxID=467358 RepID=A0A9P0DMB3_9CUCU|nr:unnamed protein product [Ceutorhynchus assimilis]